MRPTALSLFVALSLGVLLLPSCGLFGDGKDPGDEDDGDEDGGGNDGGTGGAGDADNDGYTVADGDCDDDDPWVNPGETEYCDSIDNDCDSVIDEDDAVNAITWYQDDDGDLHGTAESQTEACNQPEGYASSDDDCDDSDPDRHPDNASDRTRRPHLGSPFR